jgi:tRNA(Leu) C34 or U34 (ribose-2'-O)-methylase TrmL
MKEEKKRKRGYFGIAFYEPKFKENIGTAVRNAHCFGADFIIIIGRRYKSQPTDTMKTERHIPIFEYSDLNDFLNHVPVGCEIVSVEVDGDDIRNFIHPNRAVYIIGGEDRTLPIIDNSKRISFPTNYCVNMAVASALVLYDRKIKEN